MTGYPLLVAIWSAGPSMVAGADHSTSQRGDTVVRVRFEALDSVSAAQRSGDGRIAIERDAGGRRLLHIARPQASGAGSTFARFALPVDSLRGVRVNVLADVEARDVSTPAQPWSGVKVMLVVDGGRRPIYAQRSHLWGTIPRRTIWFTTDVPLAARDATLMLGIEDATGDLLVHSVDVEVAARPRPTLVAIPVSPALAALPRLRGAMVDPRATSADLRTLGREWGANVIRWQLRRDEPDSGASSAGDVAPFDRWLDGALANFDRALPAIGRAGMRVVLDLHSPPGGASDGQARLFTSTPYQDALVKAWTRIAQRYRGQHNIVAFDLLNEPIEGRVAPGVADWNALAGRVAHAIRAVDSSRLIVVESGEGASPAAFAYLVPLALPGIVYSVHMYEPLAFTQQGIHGRPEGVEYPGVADDIWWDRGQLRDVLRPVRDFQRDYGARILVGEFSAVRWAPDDGAYRYLRDLVGLFEENGWDWTYHAYRECPCWSVEHAGANGDDRLSTRPTTREQLLREQFRRNVRRPRIASDQ